MPLENINAFLGAAVLGVIGAAGMYVYESYRQQKNQHAMAKDLARLDNELNKVKRELELLIKQKHEKSEKSNRVKKNRSLAKTNSIVSISTQDDYLSASNLDSSDLEFYDVSDHESDTIEETYPSLENVLHDIDYSLESDSVPQLEHVLERLNNLLLEYPNNPEILWRIGKSHHNISEQIENKDIIKDHIERGIEACRKALEINFDHAEIHKWLAILIGSRSEMVSTKEKINDGHLFKKHVDLALGLNPNDPSLHHMLGRFDYEVASLKWYERQVAATLFAKPPNATYDDALKHFLEAEKLAEFKWKENKLMIAKCKIALKQYEEALHWLQKASECGQSEELDDKIDFEIKELLNIYGKYNR